MGVPVDSQSPQNPYRDRIWHVLPIALAEPRIGSGMFCRLFRPSCACVMAAAAEARGWWACALAAA